MMVAVGFIGDEVSAAGWRLAGARVMTPAPGEEEQTVRASLQQTGVLILTDGVAAALPGPLLAQLQAGKAPLLLVVPNRQGQNVLPDLVTLLQADLGVGR